MECKNCGTKLPKNAKFCYNCGTPTSPEEEKSASDESRPPDAQDNPVNLAPGTAPANANGKENETPAPSDEQPESSPEPDGTPEARKTGSASGRDAAHEGLSEEKQEPAAASETPSSMLDDPGTWAETPPFSTFNTLDIDEGESVETDGLETIIENIGILTESDLEPASEDALPPPVMEETLIYDGSDPDGPSLPDETAGSARLDEIEALIENTDVLGDGGTALGQEDELSAPVMEETVIYDGTDPDSSTAPEEAEGAEAYTTPTDATESSVDSVDILSDAGFESNPPDDSAPSPSDAESADDTGDIDASEEDALREILSELVAIGESPDTDADLLSSEDGLVAGSAGRETMDEGEAAPSEVVTDIAETPEAPTSTISEETAGLVEDAAANEADLAEPPAELEPEQVMTENLAESPEPLPEEPEESPTAEAIQAALSETATDETVGDIPETPDVPTGTVPEETAEIVEDAAADEAELPAEPGPEQVITEDLTEVVEPRPDEPEESPITEAIQAALSETATDETVSDIPETPDAPTNTVPDETAEIVENTAPDEADLAEPPAEREQVITEDLTEVVEPLPDEPEESPTTEAIQAAISETATDETVSDIPEAPEAPTGTFPEETAEIVEDIALDDADRAEPEAEQAMTADLAEAVEPVPGEPAEIPDTESVEASLSETAMEEAVSDVAETPETPAEIAELMEDVALDDTEVAEPKPEQIITEDLAEAVEPVLGEPAEIPDAETGEAVLSETAMEEAVSDVAETPEAPAEAAELMEDVALDGTDLDELSAEPEPEHSMTEDLAEADVPVPDEPAKIPGAETGEAVLSETALEEAVSNVADTPEAPTEAAELMEDVALDDTDVAEPSAKTEAEQVVTEDLAEAAEPAPVEPEESPSAETIEAAISETLVDEAAGIADAPAGLADDSTAEIAEDVVQDGADLAEHSAEADTEQITTAGLPEAAEPPEIPDTDRVNASLSKTVAEKTTTDVVGTPDAMDDTVAAEPTEAASLDPDVTVRELSQIHFDEQGTATEDDAAPGESKETQDDTASQPAATSESDAEAADSTLPHDTGDSASAEPAESASEVPDDLEDQAMEFISSESVPIDTAESTADAIQAAAISDEPTIPDAETLELVEDIALDDNTVPAPLIELTTPEEMQVDVPGSLAPEEPPTADTIDAALSEDAVTEAVDEVFNSPEPPEDTAATEATELAEDIALDDADLPESPAEPEPEPMDTQEPEEAADRAREEQLGAVPETPLDADAVQASVFDSIPDNTPADEPEDVPGDADSPPEESAVPFADQPEAEEPADTVQEPPATEAHQDELSAEPLKHSAPEESPAAAAEEAAPGDDVSIDISGDIELEEELRAVPPFPDATDESSGIAAPPGAAAPPDVLTTAENVETLAEPPKNDTQETPPDDTQDSSAPLAPDISDSTLSGPEAKTETPLRPETQEPADPQVTEDLPDTAEAEPEAGRPPEGVGAEETEEEESLTAQSEPESDVQPEAPPERDLEALQADSVEDESIVPAPPAPDVAIETDVAPQPPATAEPPEEPAPAAVDDEESDAPVAPEPLVPEEESEPEEKTLEENAEEPAVVPEPPEITAPVDEVLTAEEPPDSPAQDVPEEEIHAAERMDDAAPPGGDTPEAEAPAESAAMDIDTQEPTPPEELEPSQGENLASSGISASEATERTLEKNVDLRVKKKTLADLEAEARSGSTEQTAPDLDIEAMFRENESGPDVSEAAAVSEAGPPSAPDVEAELAEAAAADILLEEISNGASQGDADGRPRKKTLADLEAEASSASAAESPPVSDIEALKQAPAANIGTFANQVSDTAGIMAEESEKTTLTAPEPAEAAREENQPEPDAGAPAEDQILPETDEAEAESEDLEEEKSWGLRNWMKRSNKEKPPREKKEKPPKEKKERQKIDLRATVATIGETLRNFPTKWILLICILASAVGAGIIAIGMMGSDSAKALSAVSAALAGQGTGALAEVTRAQTMLYAGLPILAGGLIALMRALQVRATESGSADEAHEHEEALEETEDAAEAAQPAEQTESVAEEGATETDYEESEEEHPQRPRFWTLGLVAAEAVCALAAFALPSLLHSRTADAFNGLWGIEMAPNASAATKFDLLMNAPIAMSIDGPPECSGTIYAEPMEIPETQDFRWTEPNGYSYDWVLMYAGVDPGNAAPIAALKKSGRSTLEFRAQGLDGEDRVAQYKPLARQAWDAYVAPQEIAAATFAPLPDVSGENGASAAPAYTFTPYTFAPIDPNGAPVQELPEVTPPPDAARSVPAGAPLDINGDGTEEDVTISDDGTAVTITIDGQSHPTTFAPDPDSTYHMYVVDIDPDDGMTELVVQSTRGGYSTARVYRYLGNTLHAATASYSVPFSVLQEGARPEGITSVLYGNKDYLIVPGDGTIYFPVGNHGGALHLALGDPFQLTQVVEQSEGEAAAEAAAAPDDAAEEAA